MGFASSPGPELLPRVKLVVLFHLLDEMPEDARRSTYMGTKATWGVANTVENTSVFWAFSQPSPGEVQVKLISWGALVTLAIGGTRGGSKALGTLNAADTASPLFIFSQSILLKDIQTRLCVRSFPTAFETAIQVRATGLKAVLKPPHRWLGEELTSRGRP